MRLQPQVVGGLGGLQTQQPAADHRAALYSLGVGQDLLQVIDRAVHEHAAVLDARHLGHEGEGAGRQHDRVVAGFDPLLRDHDLLRAVDLHRAVADVQVDPLLAVPVEARQHQLLGVAMGEERGQPHPVVGRPRLLAEGHDAIGAVRIELDQLLAEALADHAVADDHDGFEGRGDFGKNHGRVLGGWDERQESVGHPPCASAGRTDTAQFL